MVCFYADHVIGTTSLNTGYNAFGVKLWGAYPFPGCAMRFWSCECNRFAVKTTRPLRLKYREVIPPPILSNLLLLSRQRREQFPREFRGSCFSKLKLEAREPS